MVNCSVCSEDVESVKTHKTKAVKNICQQEQIYT